MLEDFKTGFYASGILHGALLLWVLIGGLFISRDVDPIPVTDVSIISGEDFAALQPQSPDAISDAPEPAEPSVEEAPELPQPAIDSPAQPAPEALASAPAVDDAPEPLPTPEPSPLPQEPEQPLDPGENAAPNLDQQATPTPQAAPRVAPEAAPAPETEVATDRELQSQTAPSEQADQVEEAQEETAPEEASTDIVTEAEEQPSSAPILSARPTARPARPAPAAVAEQTPQEEPAEDPIAASVAAAVAESTDETPEAPAVALGPPMTSGEKDSFGRQINACWSVGALSTDAKNTKIAVDFDMLPDGRPDIGSLTLFSSEGPSDAAIQKAFQNARSTIIRCGQTGYDLPRDKYEQWKQVRVNFDASGAQYR